MYIHVLGETSVRLLRLLWSLPTFKAKRILLSYNLQTLPRIIDKHNNYIASIISQVHNLQKLKKIYQLKQLIIFATK